MTFRRRIIAGLLVAATGCALWMTTRHTSPLTRNETRSTATSKPSTKASDRKAQTTDEKPDSGAIARRRVSRDWEDLTQWLQGVPPPSRDEIRARLLNLRKSWAELDPQALTAAVDALLAAGGDATTGLDFEVGNHGLLKGWPTLRVFLLDALAISDSEMATPVANRVLDTTTSADEFAIGMRTLTQAAEVTGDDAGLQARFEQMLGHPEWKGSQGFAEAFDLPRRLASADAARSLAAWDGNGRLKAMALDEFAADQPAVMVDFLKSDDLLDGMSKAQLMARADPTDSAQLETVDAFLHDVARTPEEAAMFLKLFPLRSATTGFRLYGRTPAPYNLEQVKAGDQAAFERVNTWVNDPALTSFRADLLALQKRLATWTAQAR